MRRGKRNPPAKSSPKRRAKNGPPLCRGGWTIVLIDQAPLRHKASEECRRAMTRLERARADWTRFEQEDRPAFERWRALVLGPLMSELREINAAIQQKEALVAEVEAELFFGGRRSYRAAYEAVRRRREQPQPPPGSSEGEGFFSEGGPKADGPNAGPNDRFEEELLFDAFLREFLGKNPDRMSEAEYNRLFDQFRKDFLGGGAADDARHPAPPMKAEPEAPSRLKELYRLLVRRLHPDTRADSDPNVSALWHEVQQAYGDGNIERLEMLLAFTDMQQESSGEHTTVSQMRAVLREVRRSLNALLRTLAGAKRQLAWNFAANTDRSRMENKLRSQMTRDLENRRFHLTELEEFIASWTEPKCSRSRSRRPKISADMEFPF